MADNSEENDAPAGTSDEKDKERKNLEGEGKKEATGEQGGKAKRGRPRKKGKEEKVEVAGMKNFLKTGKIKSYELDFGGGRKMLHSPVKEIGGIDKEGQERMNDEEEKGGDSIQGEEEWEKAAAAVEENETGDGTQVGDEGKMREEETEGESKRQVLLLKWASKESDRINEIIDRLNRVSLNEKKMREEIVSLKNGSANDKLEIDRLRGELTRLEARLEEGDMKVEALEKRVQNVEKECEYEGEHAESVRGDRIENGSEIGSEGGRGDDGIDENSNEKGVVGSGEGEKLEREVDSNAKTTKRGYLNCIPEAMSEREFKWELVERENRKKNLIIRGIRSVGRGIKEEVKEIIRRYMGIEIYIGKVRVVGGGTVLELESFENKLEILKRRSRLKGIDIWLEDDLTAREKQVQEWLNKIVIEERGNGLEAKLGYQKIFVDGNWYEWNDREGRVKGVNFRGKQQRE